MSSTYKRISIISRESNTRTLDVSMLEAELISRGHDVIVLSKLLTKETSIRAAGYLGHVLRQEAAILASDIVVLDTYCIPVSMLPHRKSTKVVQLWHALSAVKKFGWQTVGKEGGSSERVARLMKMHHGYDYVVCSSDVTADHFCEAFRIGRDRIVKCGLPRIDYIKSVSNGERKEDTKRRILSAYPGLATANPGRKIVLYAPTFRKGKTVDTDSLISVLDPQKYDVVIKLHPLYRGKAAVTGGDGTSENIGVSSYNIIFDEEFSSYDWLSIADIVISDYSSFVIESTIADKPLFVYAYDLEEYKENTGLNVDFESEPISPYVFTDACTMATTIDELYGAGEDRRNSAYDLNALHAFRDRYIDISTENCTAALADFIESLM